MEQKDNSFARVLFYIGVVVYIGCALYTFTVPGGGLLGSVFPKILFQVFVSFGYAVYSFGCSIFCRQLRKEDNKISPFKLHMGMAIFQVVLLIYLIVAIFSL